VMAAQSDLVTVLGQFDPKLVKTAPSGEAIPGAPNPIAQSRCREK